MLDDPKNREKIRIWSEALAFYMAWDSSSFPVFLAAVTPHSEQLTDFGCAYKDSLSLHRSYSLVFGYTMGQSVSRAYYPEMSMVDITTNSMPVYDRADCGIIRTLPHRTRRHHWFCSQIHSLVIFMVLQLIMLAASCVLFLCIGGMIPSFAVGSEHSSTALFLAELNFFGALLGFFALGLSDRVHYRGSRLSKYCLFPPAALLLPSFIAQLADVFVLGLYTIFGVREWYVQHEFSTSSYLEVIADVVLMTSLPLLLAWSTVFYVLFASFDVSFYVMRRPRRWRRQNPPSASLMEHASFKEVSLEPHQTLLRELLHRSNIVRESEPLRNLCSSSDNTCSGSHSATICALTVDHNEVRSLNMHVQTETSGRPLNDGFLPVLRQLDTILEESGNSHTSLSS
ncbi:hypothetical protein Tcan_17969 [Toxocara canis]|uniref:Uncharacterized protein n=1 Tax=Toxocara canis TaxID=6265 RepID=A0A0B2VRL1_TOXCA|nr:hypothetical protein Tcan_17969 [Toxocara canis]